LGDAGELARLLLRAETDKGFFAELKARCEEKVALFDPAVEKKALSDLLGDLNLAGA
jgi:hypothetical protein